jgi:nicotinate-nucleotide pyrophosphorylase (carboxylating)
MAKDPSYITDDAVKNFIEAALKEDVGDGDHSSLAAIPASARSRARLIIKGNGKLAGVALAEKIFHQVDPSLEVKILLQDGAEVKVGDIGITVAGSARSILTSERLVLNCMQRMSGIATHTDQLNKLISGTKARLLDTRKTTPNFRLMEKWAVAIGGGINHRLGLFDMIMLKDNHVDFAGGIQPAIQATLKYLKEHNKNLSIVIETRNLQEVHEVLGIGGVQRIMLDNMTPSQMAEAVELIGDKFETEASGGITEAIIAEVAHTGVDYISVGALTHSAGSMDISLKAY